MWESQVLQRNPSKPNQTKPKQHRVWHACSSTTDDSRISSSTFIHFTVYLKMFSESNVRFRTRNSGSASASMLRHPSPGTPLLEQAPNQVTAGMPGVSAGVSLGAFLGHVASFEVAICLGTVSWCCSCFLGFLKEQPQSHTHPPASFPLWVNFLGLDTPS